jgi:hypothetical protein
VLRWRQATSDAELIDVLDIMHAAGRDRSLARIGIPPGQAPSLDWLSDQGLRDVYASDGADRLGLPTSAPVAVGSYVVQRFQRAVLRRWVAPAPYELAGAWTGPELRAGAERLMVGQLLRATGLIPPAALVARRGEDQWPALPETFWSQPTAAVGGWDVLHHQAGAFDIGATGREPFAKLREIGQAVDLGLTLALNPYIGRDSPIAQIALDHNLSLVDTYPWSRIAAACGSSLASRTCSLDQTELAEIERQVRKHLQVTRKDDGVVAFWVLDDYPGDVRAAVELIRRLVEEDNLSGRRARPTICGFGGRLDDSEQPTRDSRASFERSLANFSASGCDAVAVYPYSESLDGHDVDWSMAELLPYMLDRLEAHGWDRTRQPLVGIPQTFRFGAARRPTAADVTTQTAAYCAAGVSAVFFYAWNDSHAGPKHQLFNAPDLRAGAAAGLAQCRAIWAAQRSV